MRRLLTFPFVLLIAVLAPVLPATAADAPVCTVHVPGAVSATAPYTAVTPTFTGCETYPQVTWYLYGAPGQVFGQITVKNGVGQGPWRYRDYYPTGRYYLDRSDAVTPTDPPQNSTSTVVKFGSRITLVATRTSDLKVPLTGIATHYDATANAFRRWANRPVAISYSNCAGCPWKFLVMDKTDKYGKYSLGAVSPTARYYRAKVGETATTWSHTSAAVFK